MRLMYDSTSPWEIPRDAEMVAYYVDGKFTWPQEWIDLFPNAIKAPISAIGVNTAPIGDVEDGCIWPPRNAVPWVRRARADGYDPTIYVNQQNDWGPTRQAFIDAGEPEPHWWVAKYDGVQVIPAGAVAKQFAHPRDGTGPADRPWETGKHYDLSVVADYWPGIDSPGGGSGGGGAGGDDVSADEVLFLKKIKGPEGDTPYNLNDMTYWTNKFVNDLHEQVPVLIDLVAKLTTDPDIDKAWINEAMQNAARGVISDYLLQTKTYLGQMGDRLGEGLADEIVDGLAARLQGGNEDGDVATPPSPGQ